MENSLIISKVYNANTASGTAIIPLVQLSRESAIFVSNGFQPTPFIKWNFYRVDNEHNTIDVCSGRYYKTLDDALVDNEVKPPHIKAIFTFFCKICKQEHTEEVTLSPGQDLQDIIEQIDDGSICSCGAPMTDITSIVLTNGDTEYDLKLTCD